MNFLSFETALKIARMKTLKNSTRLTIAAISSIRAAGFTFVRRVEFLELHA